MSNTQETFLQQVQLAFDREDYPLLESAACGLTAQLSRAPNLHSAVLIAARLLANSPQHQKTALEIFAVAGKIVTKNLSPNDPRFFADSSVPLPTRDAVHAFEKRYGMPRINVQA